MRDKLLSFIKSLRDNNQITGYDEAAVKLAIIMPILQLLDWNIFNVNEVKPEHSTGGGMVDFALIEDGKNKLFLEAKNAGEELEKHQEQLLRYSFDQGVPLAILTNGIAWWFYLPLNEGAWEKRKFYMIDIIERDAEVITDLFIDFLSRENVLNGTSKKKAEEIHIGQQKEKIIIDTIPKAWDELISEPDESLMDLISDKVEKMCGHKPGYTQIKRFLHDYPPPTSEPVPPIRQKRQKSTESKRTKKKRTSRGEEGYIGKDISGFYFRKDYYEVRKWKDLLVKICEILYSIHRKDFKDIALSLGPPTRPYFTRTEEEMKKLARERGHPIATAPKEIKNVGLYVETYLNADAIVNRCHELLEKFGCSEKDLRIKTD